jgi:hypothetical protein
MALDALGSGGTMRTLLVGAIAAASCAVCCGTEGTNGGSGSSGSSGGDGGIIAPVPDGGSITPADDGGTGVERQLSITVTGHGAVGGGLADCQNSCSEQLLDGQSVRLIATPDQGWGFEGWQGDCSGTAACDLVMTANHAIAAVFTQLRSIQHSLSVHVQGQGRVVSTPPGIDCSSTCTADFSERQQVTLTASPVAGWQLSNWSGACSGASCTLVLTADLNVDATFTEVPLPPPISVTVQPASVTIGVGGAVQFTATVTGTNDQSVAWSVSQGSNGGTVDPFGQYVAPQTAGTYDVVATSHADPSKSGSATVAVTPNKNDMIDHGGQIFASTRTFVVWWGDSQQFPSDARSTLENLLRALNGSQYLSMLNQYLRGAQASSSFGESLFDSSTPTADGSIESVQTEACSVLAANGIAPQAGDLIIVSTSTFPSSMAGVACGWHSSATCDGQMVRLAFVPNPAGSWCDAARDYCNTGASTGAVSLVLVVTHEFMESVTDPLSSAWYNSNGGELVDVCGLPSCEALSGHTFALPLAYSNATHSCVAR